MAEGWGDSGNSPLPINKDGADYLMRKGAASGPGNFGASEGQYTLEGNYKAKKKLQPARATTRLKDV